MAPSKKAVRDIRSKHMLPESKCCRQRGTRSRSVALKSAALRRSLYSGEVGIVRASNDLPPLDSEAHQDKQNGVDDGDHVSETLYLEADVEPPKAESRSAIPSQRRDDGRRIATWATDHSIFTNSEAARKITKIMKADFVVPITEFHHRSTNPDALAMVERWFERFKQKFLWELRFEKECRETFMKHCNARFKHMMWTLRKDACKATGKVDPIEWMTWKPEYIDKKCWEPMCLKWATTAFKKKMETGKRNRNAKGHDKAPGTYCGGSICTQQHAKRLEKETGKKPEFAEVYKATHTIQGSGWGRDSSQGALLPSADQFLTSYQNKVAEHRAAHPETPEVGLNVDCYLATANPKSVSRGRIPGLPGISPDQLRENPQLYGDTSRSSTLFTQEEMNIYLDERLAEERKKTDERLEFLSHQLQTTNALLAQMMHSRTPGPHSSQKRRRKWKYLSNPEPDSN